MPEIRSGIDRAKKHMSASTTTSTHVSMIGTKQSNIISHLGKRVSFQLSEKTETALHAKSDPNICKYY